MSEYMKLKAEIEAMQARAEDLRRAEHDNEIVDIRKRILAYGFTVADLFPHEPAQSRSSRPRPRTTTKAVAGASYRANGQTWEGSSGPRPRWVRDFVTAGGKLDDLRVGDDGKTVRERNGAAAHP